jgi:hypothetical protein
MKGKMFLLAAAVFLLVAFDLFAQDQVEAPAYQDGDLWQFRVAESGLLVKSTEGIGGDYEIVYSGGKFMVRRPGGVKLEGQQQIGIVLAMLYHEQQFELLQFPLAVGKKWRAEYQQQLRGARLPVERYADSSVTGVEEITTPAGKFRAFKIERHDTGRGGTGIAPPTFELTYFYSPETRAIVKQHWECHGTAGRGACGEREIELIKFALAH